jgi:hypothetical protein
MTDYVKVIYNVNNVTTPPIISTSSIFDHAVIATHIDGSTFSWNNDSHANNNIIPTKFLTATAG